MIRVPGRLRPGARCCKAVQAFVQSPDEPGTVLGAAGGALDRLREAAGGFAEDDFGEGAAAVVLRQGSVAVDVGGEGAGVPGELEGDLLVSRGMKFGSCHARTAVTGASCGARSSGSSASTRPWGSWSTV
ncbi:hypothetical protein H0H10_13740 [Streptomyces sp. TRM S81-3]|uniref:Uncharacterized protein n=1 Tax=Streptomyces griseicoloratus TaxID=2752516 RepID=A0A926L512_9ACTN|nr:hypothetical protein [Streptomyces griseicoloratus]